MKRSASPTVDVLRHGRQRVAPSPGGALSRSGHGAVQRDVEQQQQQQQQHSCAAAAVKVEPSGSPPAQMPLLPLAQHGVHANAPTATQAAAACMPSTPAPEAAAAPAAAACSDQDPGSGPACTEQAAEEAAQLTELQHIKEETCSHQDAVDAGTGGLVSQLLAAAALLPRRVEGAAVAGTPPAGLMAQTAAAAAAAAAGSVPHSMGPPAAPVSAGLDLAGLKTLLKQRFTEPDSAKQHLLPLRYFAKLLYGTSVQLDAVQLSVLLPQLGTLLQHMRDRVSGAVQGKSVLKPSIAAEHTASLLAVLALPEVQAQLVGGGGTGGGGGVMVQELVQAVTEAQQEFASSVIKAEPLPACVGPAAGLQHLQQQEQPSGRVFMGAAGVTTVSSAAPTAAAAAASGAAAMAAADDTKVAAPAASQQPAPSYSLAQLQDHCGHWVGIPLRILAKLLPGAEGCDPAATSVLELVEQWPVLEAYLQQRIDGTLQEGESRVSVSTALTYANRMRRAGVELQARGLMSTAELQQLSDSVAAARQKWKALASAVCNGDDPEDSAAGGGAAGAAAAGGGGGGAAALAAAAATASSRRVAPARVCRERKRESFEPYWIGSSSSKAAHGTLVADAPAGSSGEDCNPDRNHRNQQAAAACGGSTGSASLLLRQAAAAADAGGGFSVADLQELLSWGDLPFDTRNAMYLILPIRQLVRLLHGPKVDPCAVQVADLLRNWQVLHEDLLQRRKGGLAAKSAGHYCQYATKLLQLVEVRDELSTAEYQQIQEQIAATQAAVLPPGKQAAAAGAGAGSPAAAGVEQQQQQQQRSTHKRVRHRVTCAKAQRQSQASDSSSTTSSEGSPSSSSVSDASDSADDDDYRAVADSSPPSKAAAAAAAAAPTADRMSASKHRRSRSTAVLSDPGDTKPSHGQDVVQQQQSQGSQQQQQQQQGVLSLAELQRVANGRPAPVPDALNKLTPLRGIARLLHGKKYDPKTVQVADLLRQWHVLQQNIMQRVAGGSESEEPMSHHTASAYCHHVEFWLQYPAVQACLTAAEVREVAAQVVETKCALRSSTSAVVKTEARSAPAAEPPVDGDRPAGVTAGTQQAAAAAAAAQEASGDVWTTGGVVVPAAAAAAVPSASEPGTAPAAAAAAQPPSAPAAVLADPSTCSTDGKVGAAESGAGTAGGQPHGDTRKRFIAAERELLQIYTQKLQPSLSQKLRFRQVMQQLSGLQAGDVRLDRFWADFEWVQVVVTDPHSTTQHWEEAIDALLSNAAA